MFRLKLSSILAVFNKVVLQLEAYIAQADADINKEREAELIASGKAKVLREERDQAKQVLQNVNSIMGK